MPYFSFALLPFFPPPPELGPKSHTSVCALKSGTRPCSPLISTRGGAVLSPALPFCTRSVLFLRLPLFPVFKYFFSPRLIANRQYFIRNLAPSPSKYDRRRSVRFGSHPLSLLTLALRVYASRQQGAVPVALPVTRLSHSASTALCHRGRARENVHKQGGVDAL